MNKKIIMILFISLSIVLCSAVSAENLETTDSGVVNGDLYSHAVQKTPYNQQTSGDNLEEVSFNITKDDAASGSTNNPSDTQSQSTQDKRIKNVTVAKLHTMIYVQDTNNRISSYVNISLDGDNDGRYEVELENNRLLNITSSANGEVYRLNENITRVYSDYLLEYDIAKYIKADTINVKVHAVSAAGFSESKIKYVGLVAAYNVENSQSDKQVHYWINSGHTWTDETATTIFNTDVDVSQYDEYNVTLTQVSTSYSTAETYFNENSLNPAEPKGYFSEDIYDITKMYKSDKNELQNIAGEGQNGPEFKTTLATLKIEIPKTANVTVTNVKVSPNNDDELLVLINNTITVSLVNTGSPVSQANVTLKIGDYSQTKEVTSLNETTKNVEFNYLPTVNSTDEISVDIDYLNGTTERLYTNTTSVCYNGYMGKSFTNGENFTTKREYTGNNTLIIEQFEYYNWNENTNASYDATQLESDKIVDVLYYQGYYWNKNLNFQLKVNGQETPIIASYSDAKGFGTYNFPSGLVVFNITEQFKTGQINNITPIQLENNSNILYGGYIVIIYANNTNKTHILINEETDRLNPEANGLTPDDYTKAYSIYENIETTPHTILYTITADADKKGESKIIFNDLEYTSMEENYNAINKLSIVTSDISNLQNGTNNVTLHSTRDNLAVLGTILVQTYDIPPKINTTLTLTVTNSTPINNTPITITLNLTDEDNNNISGQNVTLDIDGNNVNLTTDDNAIATYVYIPNKLGTQTITASYAGNDLYNNSTATASITVRKLSTKLDLKVSNTTPVNSTAISITATLTDEDNNAVANQYITLKVTDETFTVKTNVNGTAIQNYTPTTVGTQTITATYNGDSHYNNSTKQSTDINVVKIDTKLDLKVSNTTPINSTPINIAVTLTDTNGNKLSNQEIILNINGKNQTITTNKNGTLTQTYTPTILGKQTITATYTGDSQYTGSTKTINITVNKINTKLDLKVSNTTPVNNTQVTITATLTDSINNKLANQQVTLNINGKAVTTNTNANGTVTRTYTPTNTGKQNITATYKGDGKYTNSTKSTQITVRNKYSTKTVIASVNGTIGEKLTLTATVTDENNKKVNEGNLIFKINGVTIKDNGKLTGSSNPLKVKVINGIATATITPDLNMVNSDKITASYIGTTNYNASTSTPASIKISKRNATIEITTNKKTVKQGQNLTITAKVYDTTGGKKSSNLAAYSDEFVYFKINGVTVKDENGQMLKVKVVNGVATLNYTVPLGISCVLDTQSMTPKNHTIQVGFYNKNYQDIISNNPYFQVERSNITITISNATINNKTHTLSLKITIKDYLGNTVSGPNKCIIKVNGVTLKNGTTIQYYYTTDGVLDLKNTPVPQAKNYTNVEVITQDRLAYKSQRNTTTKIKVTN